MKAVSSGAMVFILPIVILALFIAGTTALPPIQKLPSTDRPFVFIHVMKTGGSSLREVISTGAAEAGVPQEQVYIPCHHGLDCRTATIPARPLSVIAGHFTWAELERGGVEQMDCMVSIRDPIDRATSCLFYFYRGAMDGVLEMTEEEFRRVALECTACNNVAAAMLMSDLPGIGNMTVNRASLNASLSEAVFASALGNLERCVIVDHMDVSHGQIWAAWAPMFLTTWFPWVSSTGNTSIPHNNTNPQPYRLPYRLMKVLEDLNNLDVRLYNRGTELMLLQLETARARGFHKRHGKGARTEAADPEPEADHCPGATPELQDMIDNNERILSKHGVSRRILSNL